MVIFCLKNSNYNLFTQTKIKILPKRNAVVFYFGRFGSKELFYLRLNVLMTLEK